MWPFGFGNKYPYTDFHELNLDWILDKIRGLESSMQHFIVDTKDTIISTVNKWLDDHPEATTTVQDGSITSVKMQADFLEEIENPFVTPEMFGAVGDGVTDDYTAFAACFNSGKNVVIPEGEYYLSAVNPVFNANVVHDFGTYPNITPIYNRPNIINDLNEIGEKIRYELSFSGYVEAVTYNTKQKRLVLAAYNYGNSPSTTFIIMNPSTLSIDNTYTVNYSIPNAISYNEDTNEILLCCYSNNQGVYRFSGDDYSYLGQLSTPDGNMYYAYDNYSKTYVSTDLSNNVYTIRLYDTNFTLIKTFSKNIETLAHQDTCYHKGIIYQLSWNKIIIINVLTEEYYYIDLHSLAEMEGITIVDDIPYIAYHTSYVDSIEYIATLSDNRETKNMDVFQNTTRYVANEDLNTILVDGTYRIYCDPANIQSLHYPGTSNGGLLIVKSAIEDNLNITIINQTFIDRAGGYQHIYTRTSISTNASSWSKWYTVMRSSRMLSEAESEAIIAKNDSVIGDYRVIITYSNNLIFVTGWILINNDTINASDTLLSNLPPSMGSPVQTFLQDQNTNLSYLAAIDYGTGILKAGRPMNNLSGHYLNISMVYPLDETV